MDRFHKAFEMAVKAHENQVRLLTGSPYIVHPLAVMGILRNFGVQDEDILIAAVLHDVVEDSSVKIEKVKEQFGDRVADLVNQVTKDKKRNYSIHDESGAVLKMADLIHNGLCMPSDNKQKIKNYIKRTEHLTKENNQLMSAHPNILKFLKKVMKRVKALE